jgi:hypothetical protein
VRGLNLCAKKERVGIIIPDNQNFTFMEVKKAIRKAYTRIREESAFELYKEEKYYTPSTPGLSVNGFHILGHMDQQMRMMSEALVRQYPFPQMNPVLT